MHMSSKLNYFHATVKSIHSVGTPLGGSLTFKGSWILLGDCEWNTFVSVKDSSKCHRFIESKWKTKLVRIYSSSGVGVRGLMDSRRNESEAGGDLVLTETSMLFLCKLLLISMKNTKAEEGLQTSEAWWHFTVVPKLRNIFQNSNNKLKVFVWLLNYALKTITWSVFNLKAANLGKWPISMLSFIWWCQYID